MDLPTWESYVTYSSGNYGVHALVFSIGNMDIYFSYKEPVAFRGSNGIICRVNDWSTTTGKHLNAIQPDKKKRIPGDQFEAALAAELKARGLSA